MDGKLISVVYYRSGYSPKSYPTGKEWEARRRIELSTACKCPSISYHLTGTKKIQQELAKPGRLEKYLSADACSQVRAFFAGLWGLDNSSDPDMHGIITDATNNPSGYVLKPQREGGGNNLYGNVNPEQIHQQRADQVTRQQPCSQKGKALLRMFSWNAFVPRSINHCFSETNNIQ